jgi:hypothetical protein
MVHELGTVFDSESGETSLISDVYTHNTIMLTLDPL